MWLISICFVLRTAPHESTGFSPARMLYGHELATPLDHLIEPPTDFLNDPLLSHSDVLQSPLSMTHDYAMICHYDLHRRPVKYAPGDLVCLKTHPRYDATANFEAELAPVYRIAQRLSEVNYRLASADGEQDLGVVHVVNLQPFHTWQTAEAHTRKVYKQGNSGDVCLGVACGGQEESAVSCQIVQDATGEDDGSSDSLDLGDLLQILVQGCHYNLRPRVHPRMTTDWSATKWTNKLHNKR